MAAATSLCGLLQGFPAEFALSFLLCLLYFYKLAMSFPTSFLALATLSLVYFLHQPQSWLGVCTGGVFPYFQNFGIQTWRAKPFLWAYWDSTQDHNYAYNIMGTMNKKRYPQASDTKGTAWTFTLSSLSWRHLPWRMNKFIPKVAASKWPVRCWQVSRCPVGQRVHKSEKGWFGWKRKVVQPEGSPCKSLQELCS